MKKGVYGVVKYGQARKGIISLVLGIIAAVLSALILRMAVVHTDGLPSIWGAVGIIDVVIAVYGVWMGIQSRHERNRSYTLARIGVVLNILIILGYIFIFILGVR